MAEQVVRAFDWRDTPLEVEELLERFGQPVWDPERARLVFDDGVDQRWLVPPAILPPPGDDEPAPVWLDRLEEGELPGKQLVILIQAGAAAVGVFDDGEPVLHKVFKRYVVRGKGRAQPLHLETRGKSRYGSRLRLQNAKLLEEEVIERLGDWWEREAPFDGVFRSCPVRLWASFTAAAPDAPWASKGVARKIPLDVHRPGFEELCRVWKFLSRGRILCPDD